MIDIDTLAGALSGSSRNWEIDIVESLDSTNLELARRFGDSSSSPHSVLWADRQTAGKGRLNRRWISVPGKDITASLIFPAPVPPSDIPKLNVCAGLALIEVLKERYALECSSRWPNDVLTDNGKLCGILSVYLPTPKAVICGIGINVNSCTDDVILDKYGRRTTLLDETGSEASRESLLASWILAFENSWPLTSEEKILELREAFDAVSFYHNRRLKILPGFGPDREGDITSEGFEGIARTIDDSGVLTIECRDGSYYRVCIDDVLIPLL